MSFEPQPGPAQPEPSPEAQAFTFRGVQAFLSGAAAVGVLTGAYFMDDPATMIGVGMLAPIAAGFTTWFVGLKAPDGRHGRLGKTMSGAVGGAFAGLVLGTFGWLAAGEGDLTVLPIVAFGGWAIWSAVGAGLAWSESIPQPSDTAALPRPGGFARSDPPPGRRAMVPLLSLRF